MTVNRARIGGVVAIVISLIAVLIALVSHKGLPFRSYEYVEAAFEDISSVRAGDDVRVGSVRVGQVHEVFYDGDQAVVKMQLPDGFDMYADATAAIGSRNGLGQRFVAIDPGTEDTPALDGMIPLDRTRSTVEVDDVLGELDAETRAALSSAVTELGVGTSGGSEDVQALLANAPELLADLGIVAEHLTADDRELVGLLLASDRLAQRFDGRTDELAALMADMSTTMGAMATSSGDPVDRALAAAPEALGDVTPALDDLSVVTGDLATAMTDLGPSLASLGEASPDLRGFLAEALGPLWKVPGVSQDAVPAFGALDDLMVDLAPITPDLRRTIELSEAPLIAIAPFASDVANWYIHANAALSEGDSRGRWLRFVPIGGTHSPSAPIPQCRLPYPAPGPEQNPSAGSLPGEC